MSLNRHIAFFFGSSLLKKVCIYIKVILVAFSQRELDSIVFLENCCKTIVYWKLAPQIAEQTKIIGRRKFEIPSVFIYQ